MEVLRGMSVRAFVFEGGYDEGRERQGKGECREVAGARTRRTQRGKREERRKRYTGRRYEWIRVYFVRIHTRK